MASSPELLESSAGRMMREGERVLRAFCSRAFWNLQRRGWPVARKQGPFLPRLTPTGDLEARKGAPSLSGLALQGEGRDAQPHGSHSPRGLHLGEKGQAGKHPQPKCRQLTPTSQAVFPGKRLALTLHHLQLPKTSFLTPYSLCRTRHPQIRPPDSKPQGRGMASRTRRPPASPSSLRPGQLAFLPRMPRWETPGAFPAQSTAAERLASRTRLGRANPAST